MLMIINLIEPRKGRTMGGKETGWVEGADTQSIDFSNSSRVPQWASGQLATFSN